MFTNPPPLIRDHFNWTFGGHFLFHFDKFSPAWASPKTQDLLLSPEWLIWWQQRSVPGGYPWVCGLSVTFSRSPLWAPRGRVVHRYREVVCVKTSGEHVMETHQHIAVPPRSAAGNKSKQQGSRNEMQEIVVIRVVARLKSADKDLLHGWLISSR